MAHRYNIGKWPGRFFHAFQNACPVILFFVCTFLMVVSVFGVQYAMMVSVITVFFQGRYKRKNNTIFKYIRLLLLGSFLILLAYATSLHLALLVSLNLCVPFLLVFLRSSQFNPKGYFAYAMLFVFLSLMPPEDPEAAYVLGEYLKHAEFLLKYRKYIPF